MSSSTNGSSPNAAFAKAAEAAKQLVEQVESYKGSLDRLQGIEGDLSGLREGVARVHDASMLLADAAERAATAYSGVEALAPEVRAHVQSVIQRSEQATVEAVRRVEKHTDQAVRQIEEHTASSVRETKQRVTEALEALASTSERSISETTKTQEGILGTAREAAEAVILRVRDQTETSLEEMSIPLQTLTLSVDRAGSENWALVESLRQTMDVARQEQRHAFGHVIREVRWVSRLALLGVVLIFLAVLFQWGGGGTEVEGVPLSEATVQVLNGVDFTQQTAGPVAVELEGSGLVTRAMTANAASDAYAETVVLLHGASAEAGQQVADFLGLPEGRVRNGTPSPLNGDLTVIVGADGVNTTR